MYVSRLRISGIRGFHGERSVDLDFSRPDGTHAGWTVMAGRNGSGKTSLLRALALMLVGPETAHTLAPSFHEWPSSKEEAGYIAVMARSSSEAASDAHLSLTLPATDSHGPGAGHSGKRRARQFTSSLLSTGSVRATVRSAGSRGETPTWS